MARKINKYSGRKLRKPDIRKVGGFTQIPNAFILNPEIGNPELRLLQYIMMYSDNRKIKTDDCCKYLGRTKQAIYPLFEKLMELGILKITDEIIEVLLPAEMKKYKLGYLKGQENVTPQVKKTLPTETENIISGGQKNLTMEVKITLPSSQENLTPEVKKIYKKALDDADIEGDINPIILYNNTRVLPVPATSGSTEQTHSNNNTKGNTGIELDLECDELMSQASPPVLAPSQHTPKVEMEKLKVEMEKLKVKIEKPGEVSSFPIDDDYSDFIPISDETIPFVEEETQPKVEPESMPIKPDIRFAEQLDNYNTSKYFLPEKLDKVKNLYNDYAEQYPNRYMTINDFEKILVYLIKATIGDLAKMNGINFCLLYHNDICYHFKGIPQFRQEMIDNPNDTNRLLKESELEE